MTRLSAVREWRRRAWDLQRFGLTPGGLRYRLAPSRLPGLLMVSLPKSGTHLLERALCLAPGVYRKLIPTVHDGNVDRHGGLPSIVESIRPGQLIVSHLTYSRERMELLSAAHGVRSFFLIRDPRDVVVSRTFFIRSQADHPDHRAFDRRSTLEAQIRLSIEGSPPEGVKSVGEWLRGFMGWLTAGVLVVRFEELIAASNGAPGGLRSLERVLEHAGVPNAAEAARRIAGAVVSTASPTFRKGLVGSWREHLGPDLLGLMNRVAGAEMSAVGYPMDAPLPDNGLALEDTALAGGSAKTEVRA